MESKVFSGCRAVLKKDGQAVGWATGVSCSLELQQQPIEVLGNVDVQEYVVTGRRISGDLSFIRLTDLDLVSQGLVPGGSASTTEVVEALGVTMQVEDQVTRKVIYQLEGLKVSGSNWRIDPRGIVAANCSYVALGLKFGSELGRGEP